MAGAAGLILSFLAGVMVGPRRRGQRVGAAAAERGRWPRSAWSPSRRRRRRRHAGADRLQLPAAARVGQARGGPREEAGDHGGRAAAPRRRRRAPRPTARADDRARRRRRGPPPRAALPPAPDAASRATAAAAAGGRGARADTDAGPARRAASRGQRSAAEGPRPRRAAGFAIQVGAFKDKASADTVVKSLKTRGFPAFAVAPAATSGGLFTVRVGVYRDRADAEAVRAACATTSSSPTSSSSSGVSVERAGRRGRGPPARPGPASRAARPRRARAARAAAREGASTPSARRPAARTSASASRAAPPPSCCSATAARAAAATARSAPRGRCRPIPAEPERVAEAAARLGLRYVVLTSVEPRRPRRTAAPRTSRPRSRAVRARAAGGRRRGADARLQGRPRRARRGARRRARRSSTTTSRRCRASSRALRPQGRYRLSLDVLRRGASAAAGAGDEERAHGRAGGDGRRGARGAARPARGAASTSVTIGQYLRPTRQHEPVAPLLPPEAFDALAARGARDSASRPSTRASSCAPRSTPRRCSTSGGGALSGPACGARRSPRSRACCSSSRSRSSGTAPWPGSRSRRCSWRSPARPGWRAARLGYVTGAVSAVGLLYWTALVVVQYGGMPLAGRRPRHARALPRLRGLPALFGWAVGRLVARLRHAPGSSAPRSSGWRREYCAPTPSSSSRGACSATASSAFLPVIQIASVTAVYGVSFLARADLGARWPARSRRRRDGAAALAGLARAPRAAPGAYGRLGAGPAARRRRGASRVGLVQGGIRQEDKWVPGERLEQRRPPPAS